MRLLGVKSVVAGLFCVAAVSAGAFAQCSARWIYSPNSGMIGVNGTINAATMWDPDGAGPIGPRLVVGGSFTIAGDQVVADVAMYDFAENRWYPLGTSRMQTVKALQVRSNGDLIAGGNFEGGSIRAIARWNGTRWVQIGGTAIVGTVETLAEGADGSLIAGGTFTLFPALSTPVNLARLDDSTWVAIGGGITGGVSTSVVQKVAVYPNGDLLVTGRFATAGSVSANGIARWNGTAWSAFGTGMSASSTVYHAIVLPGDEVLVGGSFTSAGGVTAANLARWNGSAWSAVGSDVITGPIYAMTRLGNGDLVVCGELSRVGSLSVDRIARWNGTSWSRMNAFGNSDLVAGTGEALLDRGNDGLLVFGSFWAAGLKTCNGLARIKDGGWSAVGTGITGYPSTMTATADGRLVAYGVETIDGVNITGIGQWTGSSWSNFAALGPENSYPRIEKLLTLANGDVVASGSFGSIGGVAAVNIARWDGTDWFPLGPGLFPGGWEMAQLPNGDLIVAGEPAAIGPGGAWSGVVRWNGTEWLPMGTGIGPGTWGTRVYAIAGMPNGDVIAAGKFDNAGGVTVSNIARWNGSTWSALGNGLGGTAYALAVLPNGNLVAGGDFFTAGNVSVTGLAQWDGTSWSVLGGGIDVNFLGVTEMLTRPNGDLIIAGSFSKVNGQTRNNIARWNGSNWQSFGSGTDGEISSLAALPSGEIVIGGNFKLANGKVSAGFARRTETGDPWIAEGPKSLARLAGQSATFVMKAATGYSGFSFQWYFGSQMLGVSGPNYTITNTLTSTTLTMHNLTPQDAGLYRVVLQSPTCGVWPEATASMTVNTCAGDINRDSQVDDADFVVFAAAYELLDCGDPHMPLGCPADLNADGFVDDGDFVAFVIGYDALVCP